MNFIYPFDPKRYFSHLLIVISAGVFLASLVYPDLRQFAMNKQSLLFDNYGLLIAQFIMYQFLHWDILHLLFNSYFLYSVWPEVESRMKHMKFKLFFLANTIFVGIALIALTSIYTFTLGISGFCMALLSYLWIDLYTLRHPMANQIGIMLAINVGLWFFGNISLVGHAAGAIFGILWWYSRKNF